MLDHLQQRLFAPVDVLEHEHERLGSRELLGPGTDRPGDLLLTALALDRLEHADRQAEKVGNRLVLAGVAQLLERLLERVVVGDARRRLDHLRDRPVRHAFSVREAAATEHGRALEPVDELARDSALADAGLAVEGDERGAGIAHRSRERVLEQLELGLAADERRRERAHRTALLTGAEDAARGDGLPPTPQLERLERLELDEVSHEARRRRPDEDLVRSGLLLQASGEVDRLAGRERRLALVGDDLARLDPDGTSRPSSATRSRVTRAARTARSASSSCWSGTPKAAITASPANFSTVPPCVVTQWETWSK